MYYRNKRRMLRLSTAIALVLQANLANALPTGGTVSSGTASISNTPTQTTVTQTSSKAVINWTGFNTASGQTVQFIDPSSSAITLNRVSGAATNFDGALKSNGNVWVINPNGIVIGSTGTVSTAGFLATTSAITDSDFMAGNYNFLYSTTCIGLVGCTSHASPSISNAGNITVAQAGLAALVGPNVSNTGTITAKLGKITLASGDTYTVDLAGDGLINLAASRDIDSSEISNSGTLNATGGSIVMTAAQATFVIDSLINLHGAMDADNVSVTNNNTNGDIRYGAQFGTSTGGSFSLSAAADIQIESGTQIAPASGKLNVTIGSDNQNTGGGIYMASGSGINSNGGNIVLGGGTNPLTSPAISVSDGSGPDANGVPAYADGIHLDSVKLTSAGGNITLSGIATPENDDGVTAAGVNLSGSTISSGAGSITINAPRYNGSSIVLTGTEDGIILNDSTLTAAGKGNISLIGTGAGGSTNSTGIYIDGSSAETADGAISLNGTGYVWANAENSDGIELKSSTVASTLGNITFSGSSAPAFSGTGPGNLDEGIYFASDMIKSTGTAGNTANITVSGSSGGIYMNSDTIQSSATGTTAGGIIINSASTGSVASAAIAMNGTKLIVADGAINVDADLTFTGANGIELGGGNTLQSTGKGAVTLTSEGTLFDSPTTPSAINSDESLSASVNSVSSAGGKISFLGTLANLNDINVTTPGSVLLDSPGMEINVGSGTFAIAGNSVSSALLGNITASRLLLGDAQGGVNFGNVSWNATNLPSIVADAGDIEVSGTIAKSGGTGSLALESAGDIVVDSGAQIASKAGLLNVTLDADNAAAATGGSISVNGSILSGGGNITLGGGANPLATAAIGDNYSNSGIALTSAMLNAGGGNIVLNGAGTLSGSQYGPMNADGVDLTNSTLTTSGTGTIAVTGSGGAGSQLTNGIDMTAGTITTGNGAVTLKGTGGASTNSTGLDVSGTITTTGGAIALTGTAGAGSETDIGLQTSGTISSATGGISLTGSGGSTASAESYGLGFEGGIASTGTGTGIGKIILTGTGGDGLQSTGVFLGGQISSADGAIAINGTGGSNSQGNNIGLEMVQEGPGATSITSTGTGADAATITLVGTGGKGTGASSFPTGDDGVYVNNAAITSVDGNIQISGTGQGSGVGNVGVELDGNTQIASTGKASIGLSGTGAGAAALQTDSDNFSNLVSIKAGGGNISLAGDTMNFAGSYSYGTGTSIETPGTVTIRPIASTTGIGVAGAPGTLSLSSALLYDINAGSVVIGSTSESGQIAVGTNSWNSNVSFLAGTGKIVLDGITSTAPKDSITIATDGQFVNTAGSGALAPGEGGRFLIYTQAASYDTPDGIPVNFEVSGCSYGSSCSSLPATGNGLVFSSK